MFLKVAVLALLVEICLAENPFWDIPGLYCGKPGNTKSCCRDREDQCSHRIAGTMCYCDEFCIEHGDHHEDCCPDYERVCLGILPPEPIISCLHNNRNYMEGDVRLDNCNECKCEGDGGSGSKWTCSRNPCLVDENLINQVNGNSGLGWFATNYTRFWGKTLSDGVKFSLGTYPVDQRTRMMNPVRHKQSALPDSFDARAEWPEFVAEVKDQGWCGSSWAISTADIASDRYSIMSRGLENVRLSSQQLISCDLRGQQGCGGGHLDKAWIYIQNNGLVPESCFPYEGENGSVCMVPRNTKTLEEVGCPGDRELYKISFISRFATEFDIMKEIKTSGPVQAVMRVHQDFFHYRDGVYRHSNLGNNNIVGFQSVRIIGWGTDNGRKYWLVANSWGREWGENGYFRIARGENESEIEEFVISPLSNTRVARNYRA